MPGIARCQWALHGDVGRCMVMPGMAWCQWALHGAGGHCMVMPGMAQCCWALHGAVGHCMVPSGTARCHWATRGSEPGIARCRRTWHGATRHRTGQERAMPGASKPPSRSRPRPHPHAVSSVQPRRGQRRLCRQRRIVLGARSPCPADGRYNKAACCGQANYLSNYDLPLNHMIFLQSCGQLKPG